jgi:hypothetical protein
MDEPHKSGTYLLKSFRAATKLVGKIVSLDELTNEYLKDYNIILFIDDIIGTGDQIKKKIEEKLIHNKELIDYIKDENKKIVIGSIVANEDVVRKVNETYEDKNIEIIFAESFNKDDNYFEKIKKNKSVIDSEIEIIKKYCMKVDKNRPNGYGDHALLTVFSHNCPNTSLPVLHAEKKDFIPLFKRE